MRPTLSLIRREFSAYFFSPIAYVVLAVFLAVTGHLFYLTLEQLTETGPRGIAYPMEIMVGNVAFWLVFLFIPPLLTMRLFAEERSTGTLEMLMTAPVRDWQVVVAKYVACYGFYVLMWLPTLLYLPILTDWQWTTVDIDTGDSAALWNYGIVALVLIVSILVSLGLFAMNLIRWRPFSALVWLIFLAGTLAATVALAWPMVTTHQWWTVQWQLDPGPILTTYLGLALAGAMFLSIGLFVSSLVDSQMISAIVSLFIGLIFIAGMWSPELDTSEWVYKIVFYFSVPMHFAQDFSRGIIHTRHLVLYGSVTLFGLFLTVRSLESRRWQ
jgi:ABC-type transport system involved in multi-copper enzyme maturation permease subunit